MKTKHTEIALLIEAIAFAAQKHKDQRRKDKEASPYINHPIGLANILANEAHVNNIEILCGAILHDTIEDTDTSYEELCEKFGKEIANIVAEVTDDRTLPKPQRKLAQIAHAEHASYKAKMVKLADKISNLRDIINSPPNDWDSKRKQEYFQWAAKVIDKLRGTNNVLENIFDETYNIGMSKL